MADKIIREVDSEVWRKFTGYCKMKGVLVGNKLTEILERFLKNEGL